MLDRGQLLDWFSSREIIAEALVAGLAFYLFIVHMFSSSAPFLNPALFKDRNFVASNVFIFMIGVVLFATLALLPPMLQNQLQYPVILTGLVHRAARRRHAPWHDHRRAPDLALRRAR